MNITNAHNLPEPIVAAIQNDPYDSQGSDLTVTGLISPPQIVELEKRHRGQIFVDVGDRLWATYGQLMHGLLERTVKSSPDIAKRYMSEERLFTQCRGWKISGQLDLYDRETETLFDYKFVGAYAVKMALQSGKVEWEQQLNCLRFLLWKARGILAKKIAIIGMVRDFSERVEKEGIRPVSTIEFPAWEIDAAARYIEERVALHQKARELPDGDLPPCTDEERWLRNGKYARCSRYCNAASVCAQWKSAAAPL